MTARAWWRSCGLTYTNARKMCACCNKFGIILHKKACIACTLWFCEDLYSRKMHENARGIYMCVQNAAFCKNAWIAAWLWRDCINATYENDMPKCKIVAKAKKLTIKKFVLAFLLWQVQQKWSKKA